MEGAGGEERGGGGGGGWLKGRVNESAPQEGDEWRGVRVRGRGERTRGVAGGGRQNDYFKRQKGGGGGGCGGGWGIVGEGVWGGSGGEGLVVSNSFNFLFSLFLSFFFLCG